MTFKECRKEIYDFLHDNNLILSHEARKTFKQLLQQYVCAGTEHLSQELEQVRTRKDLLEAKNKLASQASQPKKEVKLQNFNYDFIQKDNL